MPLQRAREEVRGADGLAGSTSPSLPFRGRGVRHKGYISASPQGSTRRRLDFTLGMTNWGTSQREVPKLLCQRKLSMMVLTAPEHDGSDRSEPGSGVKQICIHTRVFYLVFVV